MSEAPSCDLKIKVVPNASKSAVVGWMGDTLKVRIQAVPEDGKANKALLALLAKELDLPKHSVELLTGDTSRDKRVRIHGLSAEALSDVLGRPG